MEPIDFGSLAAPVEGRAAPEALLPAKWFFVGVEMVWSQLRLKEADRWQAAIATIKHRSFVSEFPEVNSAQFLWASERWIQDTAGKEFIRFPAWRELMAPLYRCENGLANRSWGMRPDLPASLRPSEEQLALMPSEPRTLYPTRDPCHQIFASPTQPLLPPGNAEP